MIKQLREHYPNALIQSTIPPLSNHYCFYIKEEKVYIAIPAEDLTKPEVELLKSLFPINSEPAILHKSKEAQYWYQFLLGSDFDIPVNHNNQEFRIIQFSILNSKEQFDVKDVEEALANIFSSSPVYVFTSQTDGFIVETYHPLTMTIEELYSAVQAIESDFYFKIHFFIGQFHPLDLQVRKLFQLERNLFRFSLQEMPKERVTTLTNIFPLYLLNNIDTASRKLLFARIFEAFDEDKDLAGTIKLYLENNSNTSHTAKQLFMHRNSLQYKIDKFIEKTGNDLKTFSGALTTYLACLDYSTSDRTIKNVPKN